MAASKKPPVTFGVELEFLFAFHEDLLRDFVDKGKAKKSEQYPSTLEISKGPEDYEDRIKIKHLNEKNDPVFPKLPNRAYNSWFFHDTATNRTFYYRDQPAKILLKELEKVTLFRPVVIDLTISNHSQWAFLKKKSSGNNKTISNGGFWSLRNAPSVVGVGSKNIPRYATCIPDEDTPNWDTYPFQLVSNPYEDKGKFMEDFAGFLDFVKGNDKDKHTAFISNQCGFHVHVAAPQDTRALSMLARILLVYEEEIARLHPPCRRPGHENTHYLIESNRLGFIYEFDEKYTSASSGEQDALFRNESTRNCSTMAMRRRVDFDLMQSKLEIATALTTDSDQEKRKKFAEIMNWPAAQGETWTHPHEYTLGNRNRQVNFTSAARDEEFPYTIEFRQAKGILDAEDISRWVDFCIGLIKLAEDYAEGEKSGTGKRFRPLDWNSNINVFDLIKDMELGEEADEYWRQRSVIFMGYVFGDEHDRLDNEDPDKPFKDVKDLPPRRYDVKKRPYPFPEETAVETLGKVVKPPESETIPPPEGQVTLALEETVIPSTATTSTEDWDVENKEQIALYKKAMDSYPYMMPDSSIECPAGIMAKEAMIRVDGGSSWQVKDYSSSEWIMEKTRSTLRDPVSGIECGGLCGLTALVQSIKAQYPNSIYGKDPNLKPESLIPTLREVLGKKKMTDISNNQSPDDVDKVLSRLTDGKFALVTVPVDFNGTGRTADDVTKPGDRAIRTTEDIWGISKEDGIVRRANNLYMHFKVNNKTGLGHWQSMRRKK